MIARVQEECPLLAVWRKIRRGRFTASESSSAVAKRYQARIAGQLDGTRSWKVSAHTGHRQSDRADELAKRGIGS